MGLNNKLSKWKEYFVGNENDYENEEYEYENEYEEEAVAPAAAPKVNQVTRNHAGGYNSVAQRQNSMKVVVVEPKEFNDSESIANHLRDLRPVVINFEKTDANVSTRIIDFISGATFALDGKLEKIGNNIFICVPMNISVDYGENNVYSDLSDKLAWKEPQL